LETYIGDIGLFAFDFALMDWLPCEGQTLNITDYEALFALIGNRYGGNDMTTFCLPDLRNVLPMKEMGMHYCIATAGVFPQQN
jgi:microcystin-dependent protein